MTSESGLRRELRLGDLILFNIAAVAGIRWLAAAAHTGPASIPLWIGAAALFFVPSAAAVSALSAGDAREGGLYVWTRDAFGPWHGFLCGYLYWVTNLFYYPSLALAGVAMATAIPGPAYAALGEDRVFVTAASLAAIIAVTAANILGLNVAKWIGNAGGSATYLAGALLIFVGAWVWLRRGSATPLDFSPRLDWERVNFWPQLAFAFGGLELAPLLGGEMRNARDARRAVWISGASIALFYIAGTAAMLVILPAAGISAVTGLTQAGTEASRALGASWPGPALALLVTLGVAGQLTAWIGATSRLPLMLGMDRYLPTAFTRLHPRFRTPVFALVAQGAACCVFLLLTQAGDNLRSGYQLLVDMTVITYFIPFLYLFGASWRAGERWTAACGAAVTLIAIGFSFVPPGGVESPLLFEAKLVGGTAALLGLGWLWFRTR